MRPLLWLDSAKRSFWAPPAAAMLLGAVLGFAVPLLDEASNGVLGIFSTSDLGSARSLLEVIATVTVSVAGITFSVTVVALQLASQQLSPRVLSTFQARWLGRATLALFLGIFVFALTALGRLGSLEESPNLVLTVAVSGSIIAFALFAAYIHDIVVSLRASTVIDRIGADAHRLFEHPYPSGVGDPPADEAVAATAISRRLEQGEVEVVRAPRSGYLVAVDGNGLIQAAREHDGVVIQRLGVGDFAVSGTVLAELEAADPGELAEAATGAFELARERSIVQDVAFPIRQLADVALRALSPSLNDPTTAENAAGAIAEALIRLAGGERPAAVRLDAEGVPRLHTLAPDLDDLVRLGFDQLRVSIGADPLLPGKLLGLLAEIERVARETGHETAELHRQQDLIRGEA